MGIGLEAGFQGFQNSFCCGQALYGTENIGLEANIFAIDEKFKSSDT